MKILSGIMLQLNLAKTPREKDNQTNTVDDTHPDHFTTIL
jgi:hypothetical protein